MGQKIERDHQRFHKLVRGKVKSNLSKYISRGEMIGKKGKDLVSIPLPQIDIPQFRYGQKGSGGVGQGGGAQTQPRLRPRPSRRSWHACSARARAVSDSQAALSTNIPAL